MWLYQTVSFSFFLPFYFYVANHVPKMRHLRALCLWHCPAKTCIYERLHVGAGSIMDKVWTQDQNNNNNNTTNKKVRGSNPSVVEVLGNLLIPYCLCLQSDDGWTVEWKQMWKLQWLATDAENALIFPREDDILIVKKSVFQYQGVNCTVCWTHRDMYIYIISKSTITRSNDNV